MSESAEYPIDRRVPLEDGSDLPQMWCIWGAGLIGYTLACVLAERGYRCTLVDIDPVRVASINDAACPLQPLPAGFAMPQPDTLSRMTAVHFDDAASLSAHRRHLITVPTEKDGVPDSNALGRVCGRLASFPLPAQPYYVVIESTICPDWIDEVVHRTFAGRGFEHGRHYAVGCSPRRDVFYDPAYTIVSVTKVIGGETPDVVEEMRALYTRAGCTVVLAPDARYAALTKPVENLFRHVSIMLANRLAAALPDWNIREVLRLAGTKWNLDTYYPSIGIGGYCVPLASSYVEPLVDGDFRDWMRELQSQEEVFAEQLLGSVRHHLAGKRVGVLGYAYAPDLKVHVRSPAQRLIRFLRPISSVVEVNDPLYHADELTRIAQAPPFRFPEDLDRFDALVLMTKHSRYVSISDDVLNASIRPGTVILDNSGGWRHRRFGPEVTYRELGS